MVGKIWEVFEEYYLLFNRWMQDLSPMALVLHMHPGRRNCRLGFLNKWRIPSRHHGFQCEVIIHDLHDLGGSPHDKTEATSYYSMVTSPLYWLHMDFINLLHMDYINWLHMDFINLLHMDYIWILSDDHCWHWLIHIPYHHLRKPPWSTPWFWRGSRDRGPGRVLGLRREPGAAGHLSHDHGIANHGIFRKKNQPATGG